jgi:hypothetical protein
MKIRAWRRLQGGSWRRPCHQVEDLLAKKVNEMIAKKELITKTIIKNEALKILAQLKRSGEVPENTYKFSPRFISNFMRRQRLVVIRKKDLDQLPCEHAHKVIDHLVHVRLLLKKYKIEKNQPLSISRIIAADATAVWIPGPNGENVRYTVMLAGRANGSKVCPMVVVEGGVAPEVVVKYRGSLAILQSDKTWMDTANTKQWLSKTLFSKDGWVLRICRGD